VALIKIRTLASAGVPLSQIGPLLQADVAEFTQAVAGIDRQLRAEIDRLEASRRQVVQLTAGDSLVLPPEVVGYLDRLRQIGTSRRMLESERDGWILIAARWPDRVIEWMPGKLAELEDPRVVRLYRLLSEVFETDNGGDDDPRLIEVADIMAGLAEQADSAGQSFPEDVAQDDLPFDLLDAMAVEADPRAKRLVALMRERGWSGWTRMERLEPGPAG
jgi:hypothetical protein